MAAAQSAVFFPCGTVYIIMQAQRTASRGISRGMSRGRSPSRAGRSSFRNLPPNTLRVIANALGSRNLAALSGTSRATRTATQTQLKVHKDVAEIFRNVSRLLADHTIPDMVGAQIPNTRFYVIKTGDDVWTVRGTFAIKGRPFEVVVRYQPAQFDANYYDQYDVQEYEMWVRDRGQTVVHLDRRGLSKIMVLKALERDVKAAFKEFISKRISKYIDDVNAIRFP